MWYDPKMIKRTTSDRAIQILLQGGVGVLPTDTVYGLVARAADPEAVAKLYELKHREHKPGTVIAASVEQLVELGIDDSILQSVRLFWPGPLSAVLPVGSGLAYLHQGLDSLAVRIPDYPQLTELLRATGPLVTSSANQPGSPVAENLNEAEQYFGETVDFYVDGGDQSGRLPSTIVRIKQAELELLRDGAMRMYPAVSGCPFCLENGLLKGEILAQARYAYLAVANSAPGNYLIIPRQHATCPEDLSAEWWDSLRELVGRVPGRGEHYNLNFNLGRLAGQSVGHLHCWVIPRRAGLSSSGKGVSRLIAEADALAAVVRPD